MAGTDAPGVNPGRVLGSALLAVGLIGYGYGVVSPYPGRSFTVTAVMVGIALIAMHGAVETEEVER